MLQNNDREMLDKLQSSIKDLPKSFDEYIEKLLKIFEEAKDLQKQYGCNFDFNLE